MKNKLCGYFILVSILLITSCLSTPSTASSISSTYSRKTRTLIINGNTLSEDITDAGFTSWCCKDYVYGGVTLVEVGYFDLNGNRYGFILYDGGDTGDLTLFYREGLNYRWDWGDNGNYSIVIKPDGTALYYDFSTSKDGTAKPSDIYKAYKKR